MESRRFDIDGFTAWLRDKEKESSHKRNWLPALTCPIRQFLEETEEDVKSSDCVSQFYIELNGTPLTTPWWLPDFIGQVDSISPGWHWHESPQTYLELLETFLQYENTKD